MILLGGGAVIGAAMSLAPSPIVFPVQAAGTASSGLYMQVDSNGDAPLDISSIVLGGPNAADFQLTLTGVGGTNCVSTLVAPGSLCDLELTFSPAATATGTRTATQNAPPTAGARHVGCADRLCHVNNDWKI